MRLVLTLLLRSLTVQAEDCSTVITDMQNNAKELKWPQDRPITMEKNYIYQNASKAIKVRFQKLPEKVTLEAREKEQNKFLEIITDVLVISEINASAALEKYAERLKKCTHVQSDCAGAINSGSVNQKINNLESISVPPTTTRPR